jgi:glycine/D-amino acid oxidase-like deaminating enzyme
VCGAGVAGLSVAWHLTRRAPFRDLVIVDERPPLSLTSDKSTECYRDWWPDRPMIALVRRSIEWLDRIAAATGNAIALNRHGYLFATARREGAAALEARARATTALAGAPLRIHRGRASDPAWCEPAWDRPEATADGADLFLDPGEIRRRFPWLAPDTLAALHTRRCGWLAAQQLGMRWLEEARDAGARLVEGRVAAVDLDGRRVAGVRVERPAGSVERIATSCFVDAAGPFAGDVARLLDVELPIFHELHLKVVFDDERGAVPRAAPLVCWEDPVALDWSDEERRELAADPATARLTAELPAGVHFRPEGGLGGRRAVLLWNHDVPRVEPRLPFSADPLHVPVVVGGVARALPAFAPYVEGGPRPFVDGGYYTKTVENRPLVGPLSPTLEGAWLIGALSGFGIMASPAAGELLAAQVAGEPLPDWHRAFLPTRYEDAGYLAELAALESGQL